MFILTDPVDKHWNERAFSTPWPLVAVVGSYLYFVLKAGPRMMANRPAYSLRAIIAGYNLFLVFFSFWFFIKMYGLLEGHFFIAHCKPRLLPQETYDGINDLGYLFFLSKLFELLETGFFILRKKMNQVTFLHVYHHTNMALLTWAFLRAAPGSQMGIVACLNSFVHGLMYSYYFLATFGPAVQKYLWWKKYLTRIQIIQFIMVICFYLWLFLSPGCQISKEFSVLTVCNTTSFLVLFLFFYVKEYSLKKSKQR